MDRYEIIIRLPVAIEGDPTDEATIGAALEVLVEHLNAREPEIGSIACAREVRAEIRRLP